MMQKFAIFFATFAMLVSQLAWADEQSELFYHLRISSDMSQKQRTDICANALKVGREIEIPVSLKSGLGLIGGGTVAWLLGNSRQQELNKFREGIDTITKNMAKKQRAKSLGEGSEASKLRTYEGYTDATVEDISSIARGFHTMNASLFSQRLREALDRVKFLRKAFDETFASHLDEMKKINFNVESLTPFGRQVYSHYNDLESLRKELNYAVNISFARELNTDDVKLLLKNTDQIATKISGYKNGKDVGQELAVKDFWNEMYDFSKPTDAAMVRSAKNLKLAGNVMAAGGTVLSLYGMYSLVKEANKSESGPYTLATATLGNVRGICQKAVSDDYDPSAVHSVTTVLTFAADVKGYYATEQSDGSDPGTTHSDGKTSK